MNEGGFYCPGASKDFIDWLRSQMIELPMKVQKSEGEKDMRFTIWMFLIPLQEEPFVIHIPIGAKVLNVGVQKEQPVFWVCFSNNGDIIKEPRKFIVLSTGKSIGIEGYNSCDYCGTFMIMGDRFVGHLYELK